MFRSLVVIVFQFTLLTACVARDSVNRPATWPSGSEELLDGNAAHFDTTEQLYARSVFLVDQPSALQTSTPHNLRQRALDACEVTASFGDLAGEPWATDAFARAELLLVRMLQTCERTLGAWHPSVAVALNDLAVLYQAHGLYAKAVPLLRRALEISERTHGAMDPEVANLLNNLALLHYVTGDYGAAESLYVRALHIREQALGPMHPEVAASLTNLALLCSKRGDHARAERLYLRALAIHEKASGKLHPDVAFDLNGLAGLHAAQGHHDQAEALMLRALGIESATLGPTHPYVATILSNLAGLYLARGAPERALPLEDRVAEIQESQLALDLAGLSESDMRAQMALLQDETEAIVSLHADAMPASPQALALALTTVLRRKGRILDAVADDRRNMRGHLTPALRDRMDRLAAASTELSRRLRGTFDAAAEASGTAAVSRLRARIEELESELSAASAEFRSRSQPVTIASVQAALPHGAALVEFVRYRRFDARQVAPWREPRYAAYVLPRRGPPRWVALGEAAAIDAAIADVVAAMTRSTSVEAARAALRALDRQVFDPVRGMLDGTHVIVSPDGKLNLVPFEALIDPQGRHVIEQLLVSYVTSGRDLLRIAARMAPRSPVALIADPAYGSPGDRARRFLPLAGARAEVAELSVLFPGARLLTGMRATSAALKALVGAAVIHIATHGLYARDVAATSRSAGPLATPAGVAARRDLRGMYIELQSWAPAIPASVLGTPIDALDRAGLAMAGANVSPEGIVSARELAGLDWRGTQLVVLSACETGVGAVATGEGVYGMRRALVLAGTESQVLSLWNVNDAATRELMRTFYRELVQGTGRAEALRRAKHRLLRDPQFTHPYYWAAFIPAGDWRPLAASVLPPRGA